MVQMFLSQLAIRGITDVTKLANGNQLDDHTVSEQQLGGKYHQKYLKYKQIYEELLQLKQAKYYQ